jgi:hypothetical protein
MNYEAEWPDWLYHVTYSGRLQSITQHGLRPGCGRSIGSSAYDSHCENRLFLTAGDGIIFWYGKAEDFANHNSDNAFADDLTPIVIAVDMDVEDAKLEIDALGTRDAGGSKAYITGQRIPPDRLLVFHDGDWWRLEDFSGDFEDAYNVEEPDPPEYDEDSDEEPDEEEPLYYLKSNDDNPYYPQDEDLI